MRQDLNKILTENARVGHERSYREQRRKTKYEIRDEDGNPFGGRESMKKRYSTYGDRKEFNENLSPLKRMIEKNVGRKWDDFYSEFCQNFDKRKVVNDHILLHLFQYVKINTKKVDGEIFIYDNYSGWRDLEYASYVLWYVDPETDILMTNDRRVSNAARRRKYAEIEKSKNKEARILIDENTELNKVDGIWYVYNYKDARKIEYYYTRPGNIDIKAWDKMNPQQKTIRGIQHQRTFSNGAFDIPPTSHYFIESWSRIQPKKTVISRESANHKVLAKYNLSNDVIEKAPTRSELRKYK
jgi:hypothetical protein